MDDELPDSDAICCALTANRTVEVIYQVLRHYLPHYEKIPGDYGTSLPDDLVFPDEDALLRYCVADPGLQASFFWNQWHDNPHRLMAGASLTSDGQLVMSLTVQGTESGQRETHYLADLQALTGSDCGVVYYAQYPEFRDGADFRLRYCKP